MSANPTKWSNTLKQFVGNLPTNCLSVFDHFVKLALKGLRLILIYLNCPIRKFHLLPDVEILWKHTVSAEFWAIYPKLYRNFAVPQNVCIRKLGESFVFYAVYPIHSKAYLWLRQTMFVAFNICIALHDNAQSATRL